MAEVWLLMKSFWEHQQPLAAYSTKAEASRMLDAIQAEAKRRCDHDVEDTHYLERNLYVLEAKLDAVVTFQEADDA